MRNIFHVSLLICLFALSGNIYPGVEQHPSVAYSASVAAAHHTPFGDIESAIFTVPDPLFTVAEKSGNSTSKIDSRTSASVQPASIREPRLAQANYLRHAEFLLVSQSVRTMIYPFHSFL